MHAPTLAQFMTQRPKTIRRDESLLVADKTMKKLKVRHLPVLDGGQIVGILSERDVRLVDGVAELAATKVDDVCNEDVVTFDVATSLAVVCTAMAERRIGAAVITEDGELAGIFTTTDACRLLATMLDPEMGVLS